MATYGKKTTSQSAHRLGMLGEAGSPSNHHATSLSRGWGTSLAARPRVVSKPVRPASNKPATSIYDLPESEEETVSKPPRKGAIKGTPFRAQKNVYDFSDSQDETPRAKAVTAKRKRNVESPATSSTRSPTTIRTQPNAVERLKLAKGVIHDPLGSEPSIPRKSGNIKSEPKRNAPSKPVQAQSKNVPIPIVQQRKRAADSDLFEFPESSGDEAKSTTSIISRSRRKRSKTPSTVAKVSSVKAVDNTKKPLRKTSVSHSTRSMRASSESVFETMEENTRKQSTKYSSRSVATNARGRATKSPAERKISKQTRRRTPEITTSLIKGSSAPEPLSYMVTRSSSRAQTPSSTPLSPGSPMIDAFRTPSPRPVQQRKRQLTGTITPKQTALWSQLLDNSDDDVAVPISKLRLSTSAPRPRASASLSTVSEAGKAKRMRLVDSLKSSATIEEAESESEDDSDAVSDEDKMNLDQKLDSQAPGFVSQFQFTTKATYGQERSHLQENNEDAMFDMLVDDIAQPKEIEKPQSQFDFGLESDEDDANQPKTMHELRATGSKQRTIAELEHLVDGIRGHGLTSLSAQRIDLVELTKKIVDSSVLDLLLNHGLEGHLLKAFVESKDQIFHFLAAICLSLIINGSSNLAVLLSVYRSGFVEHLLDLLDLPADIKRVVRDRKFNMSKIAQNQITELSTTILKSEAWSTKRFETMSPKLAAIVTIERLIRKMRVLGSDGILLNEKAVLQLLGLMDPSTPTLNEDETELVLSSLESSSIGLPRTGRTPWSANALKKLALRLPQVIAIDDTSRHPVSVRLLALRLLLNLTNNNSRACDIFATSDLIIGLMRRINRGFSRLNLQSSSQLQETSLVEIMDELILSLGAMINLAELSDSARIQVLGSEGKVFRSVVAAFQKKQDTIPEVNMSPCTLLYL
jgi:wings apart-like regulator of heterochromatin